MALKSRYSSRGPSGGRTTSTRKSARRPGNKKTFSKKVARKAASAHGHPLPHTATDYRSGHVSPPLAFNLSRKRPPRLTLLTGKARGRTFEEFGELASAEREAAIRAGLPAKFLDEAIAKVGVSRNDLLVGLGIASSTAARIKQQGRTFSLADSERLGRLARLWHDARIVYETDEGTRDWLTNPVPSAGGVPLKMLATSEGFERAHRSIMQLAYGVYA